MGDFYQLLSCQITFLAKQLQSYRHHSWQLDALVRKEEWPSEMSKKQWPKLTEKY
jgi:hypothetical protein